MAHYAYIRGSGLAADWPNGSVVTPAEFATIDSRLYACFHEGGGTWSIGSDVTINGAHTWYFGSSTTVTVSGTLSVGLSTSDHMYVASQSHFAGISYFLGGVSVSSGGTFSCEQPATFSGDVTFSGDATFYGGDVSIATPFTITHDGDLGTPDGGVEASRTTFTLFGDLNLNVPPGLGNQNGRIQFTQHAHASNVSVYIREGNFRAINTTASSYSATLMHNDAVEGDWVVIANVGSANSVVVGDETLGLIASPIMAGGIGVFWFDGTYWTGGVGQPT